MDKNEAAINTRLVEEIKRLKIKQRAIILSHYYQLPEIQEIADFVGDSLELSQKAARTDASVIIFCGVNFMAETAAILSPDKIVVLPDEEAGCPMADMITYIDLQRWKQNFDRPVVVCYVNTTAEVKAESDIACTSANVVKVVDSLPAEATILFVPDKNLGNYIARKTGRKINLWEGYCNTHNKLTGDDVLEARKKHPGALVMAHPECQPEVLDLADHVASTSGILRMARESGEKEFIIGTELGIFHQLYKQCPGKEFYPASEKMVCPNMKKITLEKLHHALVTLEPRVTVPPDISERALKTLERMLDIV
jgi:quinolinate synthase